MEFIKPRFENKEKITLSISEKSRTLLVQYARYTGYIQDEVVDMLLENILKDEKFIKWVGKKRFNKKILEILELTSKDPENTTQADSNDDSEIINQPETTNDSELPF